MPIVPFSTLAERPVDLRTAFCIVGAGVAGLLIASRLAEAGQQVVVLESGLDRFDARTDGLNEVEVTNAPYVGAMSGRSRILGGSSSRYGGCMIPLTGHDMSPRPHVSLPGWPFSPAELQPYQREIDELFRLDDSSFESFSHSDLPLRHEDLDCRWPKWIAPRYRNVSFVLRETIARNPNLTVWLGATVTGFGLDAERGRLEAITARDFSGRSLTVRAQRFVLAAGTIETTRLLLQMDLQSGERIFENCDALGRYFQDHLSLRLGEVVPIDRERTSRLFGRHYRAGVRRSAHLELSAAAQRKNRVAGAFVRVEADVAEHRSIRWARSGFKEKASGSNLLHLRDAVRDSKDISRLLFDRFARRRLWMPEGVPIALQFVVEQVPMWSNRIRLARSPDALGSPKADLSWRVGETEERTFRTSVAVTRAYWSASGFDRICPVRWDRDLEDPSKSVAERARDWAHPSGTTRMGSDPRTSVVGSDLDCHHIPNLSIVSASVFPTAGVSNPTLTLMQLALRRADKFLGKSARQ